MRKVHSPKTAILSSLRHRRTAQQRRRRPVVEGLEPRALLSAVAQPAHVVIVMEENHDYSQIIGPAGSQNQMNAPYINSLAQQGALMTDSTAIEHPSQPNYLDLFSGSNQGMQGANGDLLPIQFPGVTLPFTTPNLGAEVMQAGHTFVSYSETLPSAGYDSLDTTTQGNSGNYARRHNPAVNWTDPNNPGGNLANNVMPTSINQPFTSFPTDFSQLPTVSLVVPNVADDMHDDPSPTGIQKADTWLQNNLGAYATWAQQNNSLLIVTWDENNDTSGNHIPTIFFGPMVKPGQYNEAVNHFNVLRTVEDMYGLPHAGSSAAAAAITDIWNVPSLSATAATVTSTQGGTFSGTLATFTDSDGDTNAGDFTANIDWGDGLSSTGAVSGGAAGFSVTGSHSYASEGIYTATVTMSDTTDGATAKVNPLITADYPLSATGTSVSATQSSTFSGAVAAFTDADPSGALGQYTATIDWGDGATNAGTVAANPLGGGFVVDGSHLFTASGTETVTATIHDQGGAVATASSTATVAANPLSPTANPDTFVLGPSGPYSASGATSVLANDISPDGQPQNLVATLVSSTSNGTLNLQANGSFTYTPGATFQGIDRFTYQASEGGAAGNTVTVTLLSYNASLVDKLYHQVLHRSAEDSGLIYWTGLLDQGLPLDMVATGIFNSTERLDPLVTQFYEQYLSRGTDPSGLNYWVNDWQTKGDPRDVVENILASPEFFNDAADTTTGYVTLLYQRVLQRPAEPSGLDYWVGLMSPPTNETRLQIASQFYDTHEKHVDLVNFLFGEYFLGVSPPPSAAPYVTDLDKGETEAQVEKAIIDSSDYRSNPPEPAAGAVSRALYSH